tara:strand:- start:38 stop:376 length:339 start_codon:yes stop_codon:yes gene_type:complete
MKECLNCKEKLSESKFRYQTKNDKKYLRSNCRKCEKKIYYKEDGLYRVYYLPEHHYIGMTKNIKRRLRQHRESGKLTNDHEIVGIFKTAVRAHFIETLYHVKGYEGFSDNLQ